MCHTSSDYMPGFVHNGKVVLYSVSRGEVLEMTLFFPAPIGGGGVESLIDISLSGEPVQSDYVGLPATLSDQMLDEFLAADNNGPVKKKEEASLDDLEFWSSKDKPATTVSAW